MAEECLLSGLIRHQTGHALDRSGADVGLSLTAEAVLAGGGVLGHEGGHGEEGEGAVRGFERPDRGTSSRARSRLG